MTPTDPLAGTKTIERTEWRNGQWDSASDVVIEEAPVALVYNGISHVVMMATPVDLEDFALGFSLSEGILTRAEECLDIDIIQGSNGIELSLTILSESFTRLKTQRRNLTGRTGCGLCGAESLDQVVPDLAPVTTPVNLSNEAIDRAIVQLPQQQQLQQQTGAAHAAAWCDLEGNVILVREDVGRHIALDKLLGARCRLGIDTPGFSLVTSRASYEMVMKIARFNLSVLVAVSAPTSLAIETAAKLGITLVGFAKEGRHLAYAGSCVEAPMVETKL